MKKLAVALVVLVAAGSWCVSPVEDLPRADFVLANGGEPRSLDPAFAVTTADGRLARALFEGLVILVGPGPTPAPGAAESWTSTDDGRTWRFTLRADGRWSDGAPVVADDFVYAFRRLLDPATGTRGGAFLLGLKGARAAFDAASRGPFDGDSVAVRALDARTLELEFEHAFPSPLSLLASPALAPVRRDVVERHGRRWPQPGTCVSNGPFRLVARAVRDRIRMEKNPHYWDAANVALESFEALSYDNLTTSANLYFTDRADWVTQLTPTTVEAVRRRRPEHLRIAPFYGTYFFRVNLGLKPFDVKKVRRALDLALDREGLVRAVLAGGEAPAATYLPPRDGAERPPRRDVPLARRLLAEGLKEAGLDAMPPFELLHNASPEHILICELVQAQWKEALGVVVTPGRMEQQAFLEAVRKRDYALARGSWIADYDDPLTFLDVFTSGDPNNQTTFAHARYDEIVLRALRTETDPARRKALVAEASAILEDELPVIPVYRYVSTNLLRPGVEGFFDNPLDVHYPKFFKPPRRP
ncbi:MAG TPA: peptide ABC transporter substrate-binding protein [Planctomycetota bacterium]|nr:peptide ABC transporter substrate-binding protein [Planctomycetota bacterium]